MTHGRIIDAAAGGEREKAGRLLQPVVLNRAKRGRYTLVAGMTRLEAVRLFGRSGCRPTP